MSENEYQNPTARRLDFNKGVVMMPVDTYTHSAFIALSSVAKAVYHAMFTEFRRNSSKKDSFKNPDNEVTITTTGNRYNTIESFTAYSLSICMNNTF